MVQGKVQPRTYKKFKFLLCWIFLGPNSEYAYVNLFCIFLTSLVPALTTTSFDFSGKRRLAKFTERFPDAAIVSTLSRQLSWSPMATIMALKTPQARQLKCRTELPPKAELEQHLYLALIETRERLAQQGKLLQCFFNNLNP